MFEGRYSVKESDVFGKDQITRVYTVKASPKDVEQLVPLKEVFMTLRWIAEKNKGQCMAEFIHKAVATKFHKRLKVELNISDTSYKGDLKVTNYVFFHRDDKWGNPISKYVNSCVKTFIEYNLIERSTMKKTTYYKRSAYSKGRKYSYTVASYIITEKGKRVK